MRPMRMAMGLAGFILLSSCVVVDEGPVQPVRPEQPQFCPMVLEPVCAQRGGERRNFRNDCEARADGFRVLYSGECRANSSPPEPQACPTIYQPVCAKRGNIERTFPNGCQADASGFRTVYPGECGTGIEPGVGPGPACPRIMAPVCARLGKDARTFNNSCEAESRGYEVVAESACPG